MFRTVTIAVAVWVLVGVPVAAVIAALRIFIWVLFAIPEMAATAAVLGAVQGFWLWSVGSAADAKQTVGLGFASGGILGLLAFPPVFSHVDGIVVDRLTATVFLIAALAGGIVAGIVSARFASVPPRNAHSFVARSVLAGWILVVTLGALDYYLYWPATADRLPVRRVSRLDVESLPAGNARGATWGGCYQYLGKLSRGSEVLGSEGGLITVVQTDGQLSVSDGSIPRLVGGVSEDGRFRFGAERRSGADSIFVLWEGTFHERGLDFKRRMTFVQADHIRNTTQIAGTAERVLCN